MELSRVLFSIKYTIVDAQVPWREKHENELYFLVLPPLQTCLKRDAERTATLKLNRHEERAKWCRHYIIETHTTLSSWPKDQFDNCFDSSVLSVAEEVEKIADKLFLNP